MGCVLIFGKWCLRLESVFVFEINEKKVVTKYIFCYIEKFL